MTLDELPSMPEPEDVASLGELDRTAAALREFVHRSGALRASALVDRGDAPSAVVETGRLLPVLATEADRLRRLPHDARLDVELPPMPDVKQLPPMEVDASTGEVAGPLGGLEHLGRAVRDLAAALGGRTTVAAEFESTNAEIPLGLAARAGEPVVVVLGEEAFEFEPEPEAN